MTECKRKKKEAKATATATNSRACQCLCSIDIQVDRCATSSLCVVAVCMAYLITMRSDFLMNIHSGFTPRERRTQYRCIKRNKVSQTKWREREREGVSCLAVWLLAVYTSPESHESIVRVNLCCPLQRRRSLPGHVILGWMNELEIRRIESLC